MQTPLWSEICSVYFDLFFKIFWLKKKKKKEKDVAFCVTTDTAHSDIKRIVKFSEIKLFIDA